MEQHKCLIVLLCLASVVTHISCGQYQGYKLLSVGAETKEQFDFLNQQMGQYDELDFWKGPSLNDTTVVLVPPHLEHYVKFSWTGRHMTWEEMDSNVEQTVEAGMKKFEIPMASGSSGQVIDHNNYHDYTQIVSYLYELVKKYPINMKISNMKESTFEKRQVAYVKLNGDSGGKNKPSIMIESGAHAREWIAPAATLYFIETLLQKYKAGNKDAKFLLDSYNWYIVPVTNPDGYQYTHSPQGKRLWRKNRQSISNFYYYCKGVDINRNFDVAFKTPGYCNGDTYPGEKPFSTAEARNIKNLFYSIEGSLKAYVSVHAYSQFILVPWSYSYFTTPASSTSGTLAKYMSEEIAKTSGKIYKNGTPFQLLRYTATGSSMDWAQQEKSKIIALTFELRPGQNDYRGFNLPSNEIVPTGDELYASLLVMAKKMP